MQAGCLGACGSLHPAGIRQALLVKPLRLPLRQLLASQHRLSAPRCRPLRSIPLRVSRFACSAGGVPDRSSVAASARQSENQRSGRDVQLWQTMLQHAARAALMVCVVAIGMLRPPCARARYATAAHCATDKALRDRVHAG